MLLMGLALVAGAKHGSPRQDLEVRVHDVHPTLLAPGERAIAQVQLENDWDEEIRIESLQLVLLSPDGSADLESASSEADVSSDLAVETLAPGAHRLLTLPFRAPSRSGRHHLVAVVRAHSATRSHILFSAARAITVARLRMHNLKVYPTVLPDCQGATSVQFELELLNVTFNPADDVRLLYELREHERDTLLVSGRMSLGRIAAGERRRVRSLEPVEIPTSALIAGRRLVLDFQLQPEALTERRLLAIGTGADVKVEDIVLVPPDRAPGDPVLPGETATLGFTLVNRGNQQGTSPALTVRVRAEADGKPLHVEPDTISLPNVALAPCGGSLRIGAAQGAEDVSANIPPPVLFIPQDAEEGDALVYLVVERVAEETTTDTDEGPSRASVHVDLPNLRLLDLFVPQEVRLGESASVRFRVANVKDHPQDRAAVPAGVRVRVELWQKGQRLAQEETRTRRPLGAGQSELAPIDFALRVPAQAEKGPALVRLEVDPPTPERPRGDVRESSETDNVIEVPIQLTVPLPDLVVESARVLASGTPPTLTIGAPTALFFLCLLYTSDAADE